MRLILPLILAIAIGPDMAAAQDIIRIEIDHSALHCPYLSPKFETQFTEKAEVDSVQIDRDNSIGTLYMTNGMTLSDEQISDIIVNEVGYPAPEIKAIVRDGN